MFGSYRGLLGVLSGSSHASYVVISLIEVCPCLKYAYPSFD